MFRFAIIDKKYEKDLKSLDRILNYVNKLNQINFNVSVVLREENFEKMFFN